MNSTLGSVVPLAMFLTNGSCTLAKLHTVLGQQSCLFLSLGPGAGKEKFFWGIRKHQLYVHYLEVICLEYCKETQPSSEDSFWPPHVAHGSN